MENYRFHKLLRRAFGPYTVLSAQSYNLTIWEDWIPNEVSKERLTLSSTRTPVLDIPYKMMQTKQSIQENQNARNAAGRAKEVTKASTAVQIQYKASWIVFHEVETQRKMCGGEMVQIWWKGRFRYWNRMRSKHQRTQSAAEQRNDYLLLKRSWS